MEQIHQVECIARRVPRQYIAGTAQKLWFITHLRDASHCGQWFAVRADWCSRRHVPVAHRPLCEDLLFFVDTLRHRSKKALWHKFKVFLNFCYSLLLAQRSETSLQIQFHRTSLSFFSSSLLSQHPQIAILPHLRSFSNLRHNDSLDDCSLAPRGLFSHRYIELT